MVNRKNNVPTILNALERGAFYSSCGPELHDFYVENGKAHVVCSPAAEIVLRHLCTPYLVQRVIPGQPDLTHAGFDVYPERQQYVRAVVTDVLGWGDAREAASLREAPPSRSLPKSGWRLAGMLLHSWFRLLVRVLSDKLGYGHGG